MLLCILVLLCHVGDWCCCGDLSQTQWIHGAIESRNVRQPHLPLFTLQVSLSYVKVVSQSALIVFTYFLAWFWCAFFVITFFSQQHWSPYWLFTLQIFWLGYVGTGNAVVWIPNIIKAVKKVNINYAYAFSRCIGCTSKKGAIRAAIRHICVQSRR